MRQGAGAWANAAAWAVIALLIGAAVLITNRLGFVGLFVLGALTWLIAVRAGMDQKVPTWGVEVFRAAAERPHAPEDRAAADAAHDANVSAFRFYGWCGALLAAIGALGIAWQVWSDHPP